MGIKNAELVESIELAEGLAIKSYDFREICIDGKHRVFAVRKINTSLREVLSENGIETGEDGLTHSWVLPASSTDQAIDAFIDRIEEIRLETKYYETRL